MQRCWNYSILSIIIIMKVLKWLNKLLIYLVQILRDMKRLGQKWRCRRQCYHAHVATDVYIMYMSHSYLVIFFPVNCAVYTANNLTLVHITDWIRTLIAQRRTDGSDWFGKADNLSWKKRSISTASSLKFDSLAWKPRFHSLDWNPRFWQLSLKAKFSLKPRANS
jgi:hypothetical protein